MLGGELQEELLLLLRGQQRELAELRLEMQRLSGHMENSVASHVDHALASQQEHQRILTC